MRYWFISFALCYNLLAMGQEPSSSGGYFLVEEDKFTPPEAAIIEHYLDSSPMPFMAKDMEGIERYLGNYSGQMVVLWFWKTDCRLCVDEINGLNALREEFPDSFTLLSLADDNRESLNAFLKSNIINFPIIPNARILAEGAYAHDLGYPRLFIIGHDGMIDAILPNSYFQGDHDLKSLLTSIIKKTR